MTIAREIAALRQLDVAGLAARYADLFGEPPRIRHKDWLFGRVAWKVQEQALGGLDAETKSRLATLMAETPLSLPDGTRTAPARLPRQASIGAPSPGTTITRVWRDQEIVVRVTTDGQFEWNGTPYRSLTAVAKAITSTHWNGRLFFGLTPRSKRAVTIPSPTTKGATDR